MNTGVRPMEVFRVQNQSEGMAFEQRDLRIPADLTHLKDARDWAERAAADFGLGEDEGFQVKLAMSEAVTNAIIHGSTSVGDVVELQAHEERDALVFEVRDVGVEVTVHEAVAPSALVNERGDVDEAAEHLAEGGRGLELVALVMDEVELGRRERGSVLRFVKRRAA